MPLVVWVLGCEIFVQGTSELMIAGLLPEMVGDLGISIPDAGSLLLMFAAGMLIGAPVLAAATNISVFNIGISAGPWFGGLVIGAGADYPAVAWVGAVLASAEPSGSC